jgi:two-component system C4-dicarboxylate transport response regulator DctD
VRELRNAADRLVLGMADSTLVGLVPEASARLGLNARMARFERTLLEEALARAAGDLDAVCTDLELPRRTLYDKLRRHGLALERYRAARS